MLIDLHNQKPITLTELTPDNKLFKQLNINTEELTIYQHLPDAQSYNPTHGIKFKILFVPGIELKIPDLNNLKITYFETTDDDHYHIVHSQNHTTTHHYTHKGQIIGNQ